MWGVGVGLLRVVPLFPSWYAISLPKISMHVLSFCIVTLCLVCKIWWTMAKIDNLSGWLCWDDPIESTKIVMFPCVIESTNKERSIPIVLKLLKMKHQHVQKIPKKVEHLGVLVLVLK